MQYHQYQIDQSLSPFVECIYSWEGHSANLIDIESPPTAYSSIVFNFGDPYNITNLKYKNYPVPKIFVTGQSTRNYKLHITGKVGMIGIVFKPTGLFHFLGLAMPELNNERIELSTIFPDLAEFTHGKIVNSSSLDQKVNAVRHFLSCLADNGQYATPAITEASNQILDEMGVIDLAQLIKNSFMSRRSFERKFVEEVGISPKFYAKIRRYGYVCAMIAGKREVNFSDILFKAGYYDQSHFIKDFKFFSGKSPRLYSKTNNELAHILKETFKRQTES